MVEHSLYARTHESKQPIASPNVCQNHSQTTSSTSRRCGGTPAARPLAPAWCRPLPTVPGTW